MTGFPVKLYVYDLSRGLARQMSMQFIGKQIDGVWHTSVTYQGVEYYYGAGVQTSVPGGTHHGQPLEVVDMGESSLPEDVLSEYIESLKDIYRPENYDLFMHNCNNFSQDLCQFLVGKDIPAHITGLPQEVLQTPFGQIMKPMIEQSLRPITTAPSAPAPVRQPPLKPQPRHHVLYVTSASHLEELIKRKRCVSVFFTSSTCAPCRIAYPKYDELAEMYGDKCVFVKVDINQAYDISQQWQITATPTFQNYVDGEKVDDWKGASPLTLEGNINMLIQIAYPPHSHRKLSLPNILGTSSHPITYTRIPPLDKIIAKLEIAGIKDQILPRVITFIKEREAHGAREAALPDLHLWAAFIQEQIQRGANSDALFPIIDLFRVAAIDVRVGSWFAEESEHKTLRSVIEFASDDEKSYQVRLVTLQLLCNLFTSHLFVPHLCQELGGELSQLTTSSLLDVHSNVRLAASSLAFNITAHGQRRRAEGAEEVLGEISIELVVALIEGIDRETESGQTLSRLLTALGLLLYCAPNIRDSELFAICDSLEARDVVKRKKNEPIAVKGLCDEVLLLLAPE
ncbi:PPPDE putative peptidase domain-containing protein [Lipomyces tetrasporus]|uniref:PPPDE putative peptidase domain-containing protein n=1 Tax=Lipomyces tetrasporus TaxID=54092 RepID=A0AAD7QVG4_9ASCO|nr:PPPDE putative peptidase domain-containing protein [Lipomyces tetrasporus]KAJ8102207.1 PPPDE putative peptidase domain-containing protein [Lipomyces tetrasporus]